MAKLSAGLLLYRRVADGCEVLLAHPGGPYFARKDDGVWSIPKGEPEPGEELLACAIREFAEETGQQAEARAYLELGSVQQAGGKTVHAWAFEGDFDPEALCANSFELEWPPRSGRMQRFPEIDRVAFFAPAAARRKLNPAQGALIDRLLDLLR